VASNEGIALWCALKSEKAGERRQPGANRSRAEPDTANQISPPL